MKLTCYINQHKESDTDLRLGQAFCNDYIKADWPELFYEETHEECVALITQYLIDMHYYPNLPHKTGENF